jgi:hypothetical protein
MGLAQAKGERLPLARVAIAALTAVTFGLLVFSASAFGLVVRPELSPIGPDGTSASSFTGNGTLAFELATRKLYVDAGGGAAPGIYGFDASSPPAYPSLSGFAPLPTVPPNQPYSENAGLAVDNTALATAGNIYYAPALSGEGRKVYGVDASAAPLGGNFPIDPGVSPGPPVVNPNPAQIRQAGDICNTAVDSAGSLWVANYGFARVLKYNSAGVFQSSFSTSKQGTFPCNIAFDSNDDLYVAAGSFPTWKYTAASGYTVATKFDPIHSNSIAVDSVTHHVFVNHLVEGISKDVTEYDASGNFISRFAGGLEGNFQSLAVDSSRDYVYVSDAATGRIRVFGVAQTFPDLTTGATTAITNTSATLNGTVSAQGVALNDCHFEYVSESAFKASGFDDLSSGGSVPCSPAFGAIPVDSATHSVSAAVSDLSRNTPYRFRLLAANENGPINTTDAGFETVGPPIVETTGSPLRTATGARLDSRVYPHGVATTYHFEYGDQGPCDANACTATAPQPAGGVDEVQTISIRATAGQFKLTFGSDTTADLPFNASAKQVEVALAALQSIGSGNVAVGGGSGDATGSAPYVVQFGGSLAASDVSQISAQNGTVALSGTSSATVTTTTPGTASAKEVQTISIKAAAGQFKLTFGSDTTANLEFDSTAAEVQSALEALPSIGAGNVELSDGPGDATGSSPYVVSFEGALANKNVAQLEASSGTVALSGDKGTSTGTSTSGGPGDEVRLVSQQVTELEPDTTYHYRVVADNGNVDGPAFGADMTVTTRAGDAPLSHGPLPGPPGSDRAWEQVNAPDTGGNPVTSGTAFSDDGNRAVYNVAGGSPDSETGTLFNQLFAERTPTGWQTRRVYPSRVDAPESSWLYPIGKSDLSEFIAPNFPLSPTGDLTIWRMGPNGPAEKLFGVARSEWQDFIAVSGDHTRVVATFTGSLDPEHPTPSSQFYDVSSGSAELISILPDGSAPTCSSSVGISTGFKLRQTPHFLSSDGSLAFFPNPGGGNCKDPNLLYMRDIEAGTTKLISTPPVSGPTCAAALIKWTPGGTFFYTQSRLVAKDSAPASCSDAAGGGDVYRYDTTDDSLDCVTCVVPGVDAAVPSLAGNPTEFENVALHIGVAENGSRVYFRSANKLLPGTASEGTYRVDVASGDLAYVGHVGPIGDSTVESNAISPDGSVAVFKSDDPSLNAMGGQQNGGTDQYYRYDDRDRSLICVSCPEDGSLPRAEVGTGRGLVAAQQLGPNVTPLSAAGDFVFNSPTALVSADQNTAPDGQNPDAGTDVYEWRDGRLLLITDGLTDWPGTDGGRTEAPDVGGITPDGRNVFFSAAAKLTPDALDGYRRLYDARIGGGFEFPVPPKPCSLEVCQGTPKGAPEEASPGTTAIAGSGNAKPAGKGPARCSKGKRKVRKAGKTRCLKGQGQNKRHQHKANDNRRAGR